MERARRHRSKGVHSSATQEFGHTSVQLIACVGTNELPSESPPGWSGYNRSVPQNTHAPVSDGCGHTQVEGNHVELGAGSNGASRVCMKRIKDGIENNSANVGSEIHDLYHSDRIDGLHLQDGAGLPRGGYDADGDDDDDDALTPLSRPRGNRRAYRLINSDDDLEEDSDLEDHTGLREECIEPPVTRAKLIDYLDQREKISARILERIERKLDSIEHHLGVAPTTPPVPQDPMELERSRGEKIGNKTDARLRRFIRIHTATMLGIKSLRYNPIPDPPSVEEVKRFNETGTHGPSKLPGAWRPDLVGPKKSPWNNAAVRRFCQNFNESRKYGDWPAGEVERALFVQIETLRAQYKAQTAARSSKLKTASSQQSQFNDPLSRDRSEGRNKGDGEVAAMVAGVMAGEVEVDGEIATPIPPYAGYERPVPFRAGCVWAELDWSCAYDSVFMAFFTIYWQSSPVWRRDWRKQAPKWTKPLADRFDLLLGASDSGESSAEGLSTLFCNLRNQFRDQLSRFNPGRFPREGMVPTSVCAILELLFGSALGPGVDRCLFCTRCEAVSQTSHYFPLLGMLSHQDYRHNADPRLIPSETLLIRFIEALHTPTGSLLCKSCQGVQKVQSLTMKNSPWIWFEIKRGTPISPSPTILIELSSQRLTYSLHSVIYLGGKHFTVRMRDPSNDWWNYDGMRRLGVSQRDQIQHPTDLLRNGRRGAAFFIYCRSDH